MKLMSMSLQVGEFDRNALIVQNKDKSFRIHNQTFQVKYFVPILLDAFKDTLVLLKLIIHSEIRIPFSIQSPFYLFT